jgi:hypothetical protein
MMQERPDQTKANDLYQDIAGKGLEFLVAQFRFKALIEEVQNEWQ